MTKLNVGIDVREAEREFKNTIFFKKGMSHPTVKLNGNKLVLMYQRLPEYKGPYSTLGLT